LKMGEKLTPSEINEVLDALECVRVAWGRLLDAVDNKPDDLLSACDPFSGNGDIREAHTQIEAWAEDAAKTLAPIPTDNHKSPGYGAQIAKILNDGIRVQLIRWLQWNDPNGSYLDGSNGPDVGPLTLAEARAFVCGNCREDTEPPELMDAIRKYADPEVVGDGEPLESYGAFAPGAVERDRLAEAEAAVKAARAAVEAAEVVRFNAWRAVEDAKVKP
jgi:hypothetical protein